MWQRIISYGCWLISRNEDASKKIVATGILVFAFELFIGVLFWANDQSVLKWQVKAAA